MSPGLTVRAFASSDLKDWKEPGSSATKSTVRAFGFNSFNCFTMPFNVMTCGSNFGGGFNAGFPGFGGFGVSQTQRQLGTVTGSQLSQQFSTTVNAAQITDGTSNTIIAILIGIR
jgi:hypothetical protein